MHLSVYKLPCDKSMSFNTGFRFIPLLVGKFSFIGENCVIESAVIGQGCTIGNNCVLSKRSMLKDYITVLDNSVVPPDMIIPPFSIVAGCPAIIIGENAESLATTSQTEAKHRYKRFRGEQPAIGLS